MKRGEEEENAERQKESFLQKSGEEGSKEVRGESKKGNGGGGEAERVAAQDMAKR